MSRTGTKLFAALTDDGNSASFELPAVANEVNVFLADGADYDDGTLKLQSSPDGGTTWIDVPGASWTSGDGLVGTYMVFGQDVRFNAASVGAASASLTPQITYKAASTPEAVAYDTLTADGTPNIVFRRAPDLVVLMTDGVDGGGTTNFQVSPDGGTTWYDTGAAITAAGAIEFDNSNLKSRLFRVELAGSTEPTLQYWAFGAHDFVGPKVLS